MKRDRNYVTEIIVSIIVSVITSTALSIWILARWEMTNIKIDRTANKDLRNKALRRNKLSKELKLIILLDAVVIICTIINVGRILSAT